MVDVLLEVLLLLMLLVAQAPVFNDAQREGFISLDCGSPDGTKYTDEVNGVTYTSDADYIFTGEKRDVSPTTELTGLPEFFRNTRILRSARIFPVGDRNCYSLKPVRKGEKYYIRVWFMYDNYDGIEQVPIFDLYLGVNLWLTIQLSGRGSGNFYEVITMATNEFIDVCLVRKENLGHPYISGLELKPVHANAYNAAAAQDLLCIGRDDIGYSPDYTTYRYKDDPYDRFWWPFNLSNAEVLEGPSIDPGKDTNAYRPPQKVMSTAMVPTNHTAPLTRSWAMYKSWNIYPRMFVYAHVAEVDSARPAGQLREFRACIQDTNICFGTFRTNRTLNNSSTLTISSEAIPVDPRKDEYALTFQRTDQSNLPPILNAFEVYLGQDRSVIPTYEDDLNAIMEVRDFHGIKKNWMGDPCLPTKYIWEGIACNYNAADIAPGPRITHLNLSASGLNGSVSLSIGNLSSLESLDLSNNGLSGEVPDCLENLSSLTSLNLSGNYFTGSVPPVLLRKSNDGSLQLSMEGNPELCKSDSCHSSKTKSIIFIFVSVAAVVIILGITLCFWRKPMMRKLKMKGTRQAFELRAMAASSSSFNLDNRRFTYGELLDITDNFSHLLGSGGFGTVYLGILKGGNQVAVKMISRNCSGSSEFQTEAQLLTRVHHKSLVRLIGYCADGKNKALVLEYMPQGNLGEVLLGINDSNNNVILTWSQRLLIAQDIALGLEYLHVGCKPPIIHRDVKLTNVLLNDKFEAKIADFGISKVFYNYEDCSHASTTDVKGTLGYLDPEYYLLQKLNEKSDVYGFGIVLLELITGKRAVVQVSDAPDEDRISIVEWVRSYISRGDIRSILDPRLGGDWETNSAWAATELAIESCRARSIERPSMSDAVIQLKECLYGLGKVSTSAGSYSHADPGTVTMFLPSPR